MSRAWYENYSVHVHSCRESRCIGDQYIASLSILYLDEQTILYVHPPCFLHVGILRRVGGLVLWVEWEPFRTTQCHLCGLDILYSICRSSFYDVVGVYSLCLY